MTLCEIATGNRYSIPLECQAFRFPGRVSPQYRSPTVQSVKESQCVDALARSAQYWSSYSGYLREIPQLCYAFRRWSEIDLAKDIYRNATLDKIELIKMLSTRERHLDDVLDAWKGDAEALTMRMEYGADKLDSICSSLSNKVHEAVNNVASGIQAEVRLSLRQRQEEDNRLQEMMAENFQRLIKAHAGHMETVKTDMTSSVQRLGLSLLDIGASVGRQAVMLLVPNKFLNNQRMNVNQQTQDESLARWQESSLLADENINGLSSQAHALQAQQSLMFSQLSMLSWKTTELTDMTQQALHEVNNSMADVRTTISLIHEEPIRRFDIGCGVRSCSIIQDSSWKSSISTAYRVLDFHAGSVVLDQMEGWGRPRPIGAAPAAAMFPGFRIGYARVVLLHKEPKLGLAGLRQGWVDRKWPQPVDRGVRLAAPGTHTHSLPQLILVSFDFSRLVLDARATMVLRTWRQNSPCGSHPPPSCASKQYPPHPPLRKPPTLTSKVLPHTRGARSVDVDSPTSAVIPQVISSPGTVHTGAHDLNQGVRIEVDEVGHMRKVLVPDVPSTSNSTRTSSEDFRAFGIPAHPTRAYYPEICRKFVFRDAWCDNGYNCKRIHPRDKVTYRNMIMDARRLLQPITTTRVDSPVEKHEDEALPEFIEGSSQPQSVLLSNSSQSTAPVLEGGSLETGDGWDPSGSWMPASKPEAWSDLSSSPATSNDQLFSSASDLTTSTTASPESSDDDGAEKMTPDECTDKPSSRHSESDTATEVRLAEAPQPVEVSIPEAVQPVEVPRPETIQPVEVAIPGVAQRTEAAVPEVPRPAEGAVPARPTMLVAPVESPETQVVAHRGVRHPRPKTNERCIRWLRNACAYGYSCRYIHGDLEYDDDSVGPTATRPPSSTITTTTGKQPAPAPPKYLVSADEFLLSFTLHDHMRVQCSAGFDIQRVQTAFESSTLLISNISSRVRSQHLREVLSSYGVVEELHMPPTISFGTIVRVNYSDAAEAQKAQAALNGMKMYNLSLTARIAASGTMKTVAGAIFKDAAVRISWEAPAKIVYAGYSNADQAQRAIQIARTTPLNGHYLRGEIYEGMPAVDVVNVRFCGVPVNVDKADLVRFVNPADIMWTRPNYTDFEEGERLVRRRLEECGAVEHFDVLPPPYRDGGMVRAWANFSTGVKAKEAARQLDGRKPKCLGYTTIRASHVQTISYDISPDKFANLGAAIEALQVSQRRSSVIVYKRPNGFAVVRLSADEQKELAHLKNQFEKILKGEVVRRDGKAVWDSYFARREGSGFLDDLRVKNPAVYFENDVERTLIRVHAFSVDRTRFVNAIVAKVKEIRAQNISHIPLPGRLLGAVIANEDIKCLRRKHGIDNANIDIFKRVLYVRGDFHLFRTFKNAVERIAQGVPSATNHDGPLCPICFDKPSSPISLQCGHVWCRSCITHYFHATTDQKTFPLKCLGNEGRCGTKIPIGVAKSVLSGDELRAIINAAFLAHIQARPKEYHFCPTPDCPQIYRTTPEKATLQCPACLASICTRCHAEAHDGFQCADQVQDEVFKRWIKENNVKHCPTCNVLIERAEGCNHMMCTQCQTHICWQCLKTFPGGEGIYGHMREVHRTFGLGPILD
ncbi:hypothetical protein P691DRAFT_783509 [Macrolepiota fuliginosa MF-IS2]|uniref:RBR-type E3 ubiquitin transferase n=1 Tax=Macrolepiota fuliginosa MF-IS2 TaxID=1400762 RepID=A0A9P5XBI2_9AGAR|nr:hypothetical protein P691DRAFT_783509 [Macrolepiota fuliginosa MF-IS2]